MRKGFPRLFQRGGAFSLTRENAWTHKVCLKTRLLVLAHTAGLLHVLAVLRFLLSVTYFSEGMKHDAPLDGLTDGRDIAVDVRV